MTTDTAMAARRHPGRPVRSASPRRVVEPTPENFEVESVIVDTSDAYDTHFHGRDQLAWMAGGSMLVSAAAARWHLRREHFVWIPAGMLHEMSFLEPGELINVYADTRLRPDGARWEQPCVVEADELATRVLWHLVAEPRSLPRTRRCVDLLRDLLATSAVAEDTTALPRDSRARRIALRLLEDPSDDRELGEWARELGVSERTLTRAFAADDGTTFRRWRQQLRLRTAAGRLARGEGVAAAAAQVGYSTTSGFVAAFAAAFGLTPGEYARRHARESSVTNAAVARRN